MLEETFPTIFSGVVYGVVATSERKGLFSLFMHIAFAGPSCPLTQGLVLAQGDNGTHVQRDLNNGPWDGPPRHPSRLFTRVSVNDVNPDQYTTAGMDFK